MNTQRIFPTAPTAAIEVSRFMTKVYAWMALGISLTGYVAYFVPTQPALLKWIFSAPFIFYGLIIAELAAVFFLSAMVHKISATAATLIYLLYATLTGVTLSVIFLVYTKQSIEQVFLLSAFSFAGLSAYGMVTKRDLGPIGSFCMMGLFGLIGYSLLALFFPSWNGTAFDKTAAVVGVIVFAGLTAYDTQKIKLLYVPGTDGTEEERKEAILGALTLYLDFINLFLEILKLMGKKRD
jgi:FtsH-binding integral membrane protein